MGSSNGYGRIFPERHEKQGHRLLHAMWILWYTVSATGIYAPVAQRIRASDYGSEGRGFKSLRAYQSLAQLSLGLALLRPPGLEPPPASRRGVPRMPKNAPIRRVLGRILLRAYQVKRGLVKHQAPHFCHLCACSVHAHSGSSLSGPFDPLELLCHGCRWRNLPAGVEYHPQDLHTVEGTEKG